ncbi:transferrin receptor protein 2-like [Sinocyclocheilus grahami]|uniref:transferrin receptor protein 2-like n=1 Tax=Sinocyclocheilus grahami TaxID=75366 RepID=UPI0007ACBCD5|nr:PREDICTED: transferrin receptor protein 2-like [Sinocyclocheilus grahami]
MRKNLLEGLEVQMLMNSTLVLLDDLMQRFPNAAGGGAQANEGVEEGGGVRRRAPPVELKLVPLEEESEVTLNRDITSALMLQQRMDRRKAAVYLTLSGLLIFTTAFLLGFVAFRGMCRLCGNDGDLIPLSDAAGAQHSAEGGVMYTAELREMLKKYLKEERIEDTLRRVSRASHPPGSSEGNAVAREILQNLQNLRMDHTWTDSHYATLQFPSRTQRNTLWLVDSEGAELEEIPLDSEGYCAYSATGTATGGVVYVNYGRREDFEQLRVMGVALNGSIAVARVGGAVSFAEKVWLAQEAGLVGVLIYPDPADVPQDPRRLGLHSDAVISEHVRFYPRRSLLFVSWDGGDFGNVGATEWLEGYLTMLHLKAVAYFSLDQAILGDDILSVYTSPLLADLIEGALKQVEHPKHTGQSILSLVRRQGGWRNIVKPLYLNSGAYSFTAFGGVPAMQLHFTEDARSYPFVNTQLDSVGRLQELLQGRLGSVGRAVAELVGLMVLKLSHDQILPLDVTCYSNTAQQLSATLNQHTAQLQKCERRKI